MTGRLKDEITVTHSALVALTCCTTRPLYQTTNQGRVLEAGISVQNQGHKGVKVLQKQDGTRKFERTSARVCVCVCSMIHA